MTARCSPLLQTRESEDPLPAFLNPEAGSAEEMVRLLKDEARIRLHCLLPDKLAAAIDKAVAQGKPRVLVCGGDGTLALAASRLAGQQTELAILPGGTLNHFASQLGIPGNSGEALELALNGQARPVAAGYVNDQLFINTSSVGAYVFFVRTRNHLERRMSYQSASLLAGIRRLARFRSARVNLDGTALKTPLVFIGVNERELRFPTLGQKKPGGRNGLHMIAVKDPGRLKALKLAFGAIILGIDPLEKADQVEARILESLELSYHKARRKLIVALDGELVRLDGPLKYRFESAALTVVAPSKMEKEA